MPGTQRPQLRAERLVLTLGQSDEPQQGVRHPPAGGEHHAQRAWREAIEYGGNLSKAVGVGNARPPELVHDPGIGFGHRMALESQGEWQKCLATLLTRPRARNDSV